ncbi:MAG: cupin domain-containing protein [Actinomycetota bacterium]
MLDTDEIRALLWKPSTGQRGVTVKALWEDSKDRSTAGLMRLEPGAKVTVHTHRYSVHHVWVTEGSCSVGGKSLGPGAYCFVPAGVQHGIDAAGRGGSTLFYLYLRAEMD